MTRHPSMEHLAVAEQMLCDELGEFWPCLRERPACRDDLDASLFWCLYNAVPATEVDWVHDVVPIMAGSALRSAARVLSKHP